MNNINNSDEKKCQMCKKTFLIETHFRSIVKCEATKMCKLCRDNQIKYKNKSTSTSQKRRNIYLSHKKKKIEKTRGCEWAAGCRFNFSDKRSETFVVCEEVPNIVIFEFDHLSPEEKSFCVSNWTNNRKYTVKDLIDENAKCRILCRFHHKIHSHIQRTENKKNKSKYQCYKVPKNSPRNSG